MRFPTLHGDSVVFEAHGNLWRVSRAGGLAGRLTAEPGYDLMPRFSPDGSRIAFTASYQGNQDVYVIPASGGTAQRLTFHSDAVEKAPTRWGPDNMVVTWTPDAKSIVFLSRRMAWNTWYGRLFAVPVAGGLATPLPLDSGGLLTYSPDGNSIAYNRIFRNFRTWKRYDGGLAQQVYTYNFESKKLERITAWKGTNTAPMWYGRKIYFLSDRDKARRENIWVYDLDTKAYREVTHFTDYDIDFPSLGNDGIVFAEGGSLYVLDLPSEQLHRLDVSVPDDGTRTQPRFIDAHDSIRDSDTAGQTDYALSPNGKRALFSARGDVFSVPAKYGATRNLTSTSNADEDHPSWSPDGKTVAYTTDVSGEQQIAIRPALGGAEKILTHFGSGFFYTPDWSPDGKRLAFADANHRLWLLDVASGKTTVVTQNRYSEIHDQNFSPDGRWLAYSFSSPNQQQSIFLYSIEGGTATQISGTFSNDFSPVFSPDGKYLYFLSTRHENPTLSESEFNVATLKMTGVYVATLRKGEPSPFAPRSDEGAFESAKGEKPQSWSPGARAPIHIDIDGLMARAVPLPIPAADIASLDARDDKVFYETTPPQMIEGPLPGEKTMLHMYDMDERKDTVAIDDLDGYSMSADGQHVLYKKDKNYTILDLASAGGGKTAADGPDALDLSQMRARIEPAREWAEMFDNAWRLERDLFVNPALNGVNWQRVHAAYAKLLPLLGSREDLDYLIGEQQGELGNSHTYVGGGDDADPTPSVPTALLGADFALDPVSGRYRFAKIYPGDNSRPDYRSPLTEPGVDVHEGDYLLAVNGRELRAPADPFSSFVGLADQPVTLTVAGSTAGTGGSPGAGGTPSAGGTDGSRRSSGASGAVGTTRQVTVQPLHSELRVRENAWIEEHREMVDRLSGGKIAYIYLSDMESLGMEQFIRQFYPQIDKQALIVDDRWNGGGFIDQIVLERLRRILVGMSTNRENAAFTTPQQLIDGPKVCLLNHYSASDGDIFPFYFRKYGLGPLIGTRTWGGVRGIRGFWSLLDGGYITVPEDSLYGLQSEWVIENHGVDPDIEVETDPAQLLAGHDAQIETAVNYLMRKLRAHPGGPPPPPPHLPAYPPQGQVGPPSLP
jgi:tricorn protease